MIDYLITTRSIRNGTFSSELGPTRYLKIPSGVPTPSHEISCIDFTKQVVGTPQAQKCEDIVVFIHGYRHCGRLTNYYSPYDRFLNLSNIKRIGVAPRAVRVGLPQTAPTKAVGVDCGARFRKTSLNKQIIQ